jgi:hypothetical protein
MIVHEVKKSSTRNPRAGPVLAWLVALFTGLLTFLTPDKKADRYARASAILNAQITRYNTDLNLAVDEVLEAYTRGQAIIFDSTTARTPAALLRRVRLRQALKNVPRKFPKRRRQHDPQCPLWVISGHMRCNKSCPLYPQ